MKIQAVKDISRVRIVIPGRVSNLFFTIKEAREHARQVLAAVQELEGREEIPNRSD